MTTDHLGMTHLGIAWEKKRNTEQEDVTGQFKGETSHPTTPPSLRESSGGGGGGEGVGERV